MEIFNKPQHYIDWKSVGGYEKFIADYHDAPTYDDKRILIESLPLQTNPDWKAARRGHITASTMKDFLGMDRTGKKAGVGYKKLVKRLVAENIGWTEQELTWGDKASVKRGLCFERRAVELFEKETGIKLKTDIGFISDEIDGLPLGYSPDAYAEKDGQIVCLAEIKSFELCRLLDELETLHSPDVCEQMQAGMYLANCPRCYKILYSAELDKIFYLRYTRGQDFARRLHDRIPLALAYKDKIENNLKYTDLTDKIMDE
jgi:hypothetical protein